MKKLILILLISFTTAVFTKIKAQQKPYFNIVQVKPPQHIQDAYQAWITTNEFWLPHAEIGQWVASNIFWKVSGNEAKEYNSDYNLSGSYIVPVYVYGRDNDGNILTTPSPYISAIIISNDGSVDFRYLWGYTSWFQYVRKTQE